MLFFNQLINFSKNVANMLTLCLSKEKFKVTRQLILTLIDQQGKEVSLATL